jgi:hypothetical protein
MAEFNWEEGLFSATGSLALPGGLITMESSIFADRNYNLTMRGAGVVQLPNVGGLLRGQSASGHGYFQYRPNNLKDDDYILVYGELTDAVLGVNVLGVKVDFTGDVDSIFSMTEIERLMEPEGTGSAIDESESWRVTSDAGKAMFFAEWIITLA